MLSVGIVQIIAVYEMELLSRYPRFPSIIEEAIFFRGRKIIAHSLRVHVERAKPVIHILTH